MARKKSPARAAALFLRLETRDLDALERLARKRGFSVSEYLRGEIKKMVTAA